MQTATQRQPRLCGGVGRRFQAPLPRPGVRTCVIVPSKGSASGSSDKRLPAWLLGSADKKVLQDMRSLESLIQRDAPEPDYPGASAAPAEHPLTEASQAGSNDVDPDALRERLASAAEASTSASSSSSSSFSNNSVHHAAVVPATSDPFAHSAVPSSLVSAHSSQQQSAAEVPAVPALVSVPSLGVPSLGHEQPSASASSQQSSGVANGPAAGGPATSAPAPGDTAIPGSIWILCCISAALTCASCVFNTALPIYMVSELKMSMRSMGMFEGLLEAFSYVVRMCSGVVSDRMSSRKAAITLGFAAGAMAKFGMASAGTVGLLFAGKAVDRLANGIQAAPRDALIGDLSPPGVRSACFGLAQSLRKWGSAVGALAAFFLMKASNNNYQLIFYSAATVSLAACVAFVLFVPAHTRTPTPAAPPSAIASTLGSVDGTSTSGATDAAAAAAASPGPFAGAQEFFRSVASMGSDFYRMLGVICLYAMGHINESLLEARAMEVGFGKAEATLVVAALAAVTFLTAFPLGRLDDKYGAGTTFAVGIGALIAGDLVLLLSGPHPMALFAACAFLGVHWAVIQGPLLSIVSGLAPAHLRGTAFGIFYTVMAVTAVAANTMYGSIWHTYGANAAFATSAALMTCVLVALPHMLPAAARRGNAVAPSAAPAAGPAISLPQPGNGDGGKGPSISPMPAAA